MKGDYPITLLCELLGVSRSNYYGAKKRGPSARQRRDAELAPKIAAAHRRSRGTYGTPRIVADLREEGERIGRKRFFSKKIVFGSGLHRVWSLRDCGRTFLDGDQACGILLSIDLTETPGMRPSLPVSEPS